MTLTPADYNNSNKILSSYVVCWIYDRTLVAASISGALMRLDCGLILWFRAREPPTSADLMRPSALMMSSGSGGRPIVWSLHRDSQAFKERLFLERFAQKANSAGAHRAAAVLLVGVSGNENDWRVITPRLQPFLQFEAI